MTSYRANEPSAPAPSEQPTRPLRSGRTTTARKGINPWYILLITIVPILALACMFFSLGWYGEGWNDLLSPVHAENEVVLTPTPHMPEIGQMSLQYGTDARTYPVTDNNFFNVTGKLTNGSGKTASDIQLKAYVYDADGNLVGNGIGNVNNVAPGATVDFSVPTQLSVGSIPKDGSTPAPPKAYTTVQVYVDNAYFK